MSKDDNDMQVPLGKAKVKKIIPCGETKYWELMNGNEFPNAYTVGNRRYVPFSDIEAYRRRHRVVAA